ncbi:hypothetical protein VB796_21065 [Arcicella sp. LKC2W]|uniref:hypothetical protein n=1 Tax=Arcicella sp. LKC2W TaxID=2984198 RepID=UPI002B212E88|nr:hypothetical protein [Arcicella sp. LKC2W]MEA5461571.1 hypothetical protein [Arcicella sp. LKC2W]
MEEKEEKRGRKKKAEGAKTVRVELRLTVEQKELLDFVVNRSVFGETQTSILLEGLFNYCKYRHWFTLEMHQKYEPILNFKGKRRK